MRHLFVIAACLLFFASSAYGSGAGVRPAWIDTEYAPGRAQTSQLTVANDSVGPLTFEAIVTDLWYDPTTMNAAFLPAGSTERSAAPYVEVFPPKITVPPNSAGTFDLSINLPEGTTGGWYATIEIRNVPRRDGGGILRAQTAMAFRVPLLLRPRNGGELNFETSEAHCTLPTAGGSGRVEITMQNRGDTHRRPGVRAIVRDETGSVVANINSPTPRFYLPGQQRTSTFEWTGTTAAESSYSVIGAIRFSETGVIPFEASCAVPISSTSPEAAQDSSPEAGAPGPQ